MYSKKNIPFPFQGKQNSESPVTPSHTIPIEGNEKVCLPKAKPHAAPLAAFLLLYTLFTEKKDG